MATKYRRSPEVKEIADDIITSDDRFSYLRSVPMIYMFRDQAATKQGQMIWGTAKKLSGLTVLYARGTVHTYDTDMVEMGGFADPADWECFEIMIAYDIWEKLSEGWRRWLVKHELSHCFASEEGKLSTVGHDIELFYTDAEGMESLGLSPREFREKFKSLEIAVFQARDKQDDGETTKVGQTTIDGGVDVIEISANTGKTVCIDRNGMKQLTKLPKGYDNGESK